MKIAVGAGHWLAPLAGDFNFEDVSDVVENTKQNAGWLGKPTVLNYLRGFGELPSLASL